MIIAITGANGEFGRGVLDSLSERAPEHTLVATVRDPTLATDLVARGIDVRPGAFDDAAALSVAFAGADVVLINATFFGEVTRRGERVAAAIRAAAQAGVGRVVLTSWLGLDSCTISVVQDFVGSERLLRESGVSWTILRMGYGLPDAFARDVRWARRDGALVAPAGDAVCAPAAGTDLVEATAAVLIGSGHDGRLYELSGPRTIDWPALAALAAELDGRAIGYRSVSDKAYREHLNALALPASTVEGLLELYRDLRAGWLAQVSPALGELLGRPRLDPIDAIRQRLP